MTGLSWLGAVALRSLALAAVTGLLLATTRIRREQRLKAWTLVLYAALAMPALALLLPRMPLAIPRPARTAIPKTANTVAERPPASAMVVTEKAFATIVTPISSAGQAAIPQPASPPSAPPFDWALLLTGVYCGGLLLLLARLGAGAVMAERLRRSARPLPELGADVAESRLVAVPAAIGLRRGRVMLPPEWRDWEAEKLAAVLAHERAHLARRDGLTQGLALVHEALFWFSPLSWWLHEHLVELAEEASDAEALRGGMEPAAYAAMLVEFFRQRRRGMPRVRWHEVAMARSSHAERRVERVLEWNEGEAMTSKQHTWAWLTVAMVPVALALGAAQPRWARSGASPRGAMEVVPVTAAAASAGAATAEEQDVPTVTSSGVVAARCLSCPQPVYPPEARTAGVTGYITLTATISLDGTVQDAQWYSGDPRLIAAALGAVQHWRYSPTMLDGKARETNATITVAFDLSPNSATRSVASGTIRSHVVDPSGARIPGARVQARTDAGQVVWATTKADGSYELTGLTAPSYGLVATAPGFVDVYGKVTDTGSEDQFDFCLPVGNQATTVEVTGERSGVVGHAVESAPPPPPPLSPSEAGSGVIHRTIEAPLPPPPPPAPPEVQEQQSPKPTPMSAKAMESRCKSCPAPVYPPIAKNAHIQGTVQFDAIVGKDGTVKQLTQIGYSNVMLATAAKQAVMGWVYEPTVVDTAPVEVETTITVTFAVNQ